MTTEDVSACSLVAVRGRVTQLVIPEAAERLSGIHTFRLWLWIPGSRFARPGMTAGRRDKQDQADFA
jgi:hypothetical protein